MNKRPLILALLLAAFSNAHSTEAAHYRHQIGDITLTALLDGILYAQKSDLQDLTPNAIDALLDRSNTPQSDKGLQTAVHAFLLEREGETLLIDSGAGDCFTPKLNTLGNTPAALADARISPENIRHILLTHAHPDHICGLTDNNGKARYPNATVWISATEAQYWESDLEKNRAPQSAHWLFDRARAALAPYRAAGRLRHFDTQTPLPMNAQALDTKGHTRGHHSFLFDTHSEHPLLVWGDIANIHAVQIPAPDTSYSFDDNGEQADQSRRRILEQAIENNWHIAGTHLPFPAIGRIIRGGENEPYRWLPIEYSPQTP